MPSVRARPPYVVVVVREHVEAEDEEADADEEQPDEEDARVAQVDHCPAGVERQRREERPAGREAADEHGDEHADRSDDDRARSSRASRPASSGTVAPQHEPERAHHREQRAGQHARRRAGSSAGRTTRARASSTVAWVRRMARPSRPITREQRDAGARRRASPIRRSAARGDRHGLDGARMEHGCADGASTHRLATVKVASIVRVVEPAELEAADPVLARRRRASGRACCGSPASPAPSRSGARAGRRRRSRG